MTNRPLPLEPMTIGRLLDTGFSLWRRHFMQFFVLGLIASVPGQLLLSWYQANNVLALGPNGEALVLDVDQFQRTILVLALINLALLFLGWSASFAYGLRAYLGEEVTLGQAITTALRRLPGFFVLTVVFTVGVGLGMVFLVVPGIWLGVLLSLAFPALIAERVGPFKALSRSAQLVSGRWWPTFGLYVVVVLISMALNFMVGGIVLAIVLNTSDAALYFWGTGLVSAITAALFFPLFPCMVMAAYYDKRVRNEGFDIEFQTGSLADPYDPGGGIIR